MRNYKFVTVVTGNGCFVGTLETLQKMEKIGIIKILETRSHSVHEHWDDSEGLEWYDEDFEIIYEEVDSHPLNRTGGYDFIDMMIRGLEGVSITYERVKVA